ncbi:unnamed protein product [Rhizophagus irregularis]|uniref:MATA-HMG n=1 Tax=Rhizophagus irregularis TaxID=588596 RepID=A0A1B1ETZ2_9GLOM|nr:MATA-HMG [Rhizophagus irregularis]PKK77304.1 hypothetical protein RhiirC2_771504 [Rhizophagus irregularis]CAB4393639.1 unnamed protein product [Rhizophagus irregularis]CAB5387758.1 unnamed protein product [Rhizophagus irregularis]
MPKSISKYIISRNKYSQKMDTIGEKISFNRSKEQQKTRKVVDSPPTLNLPFPPHIVPEDLINSKTRKLPSKPSNAFFIYRKVYTRELIAQNLRFKMTDVSPWVSTSWNNEPEEVKAKYKEIAKEVRKIYKQTKLDAADESEIISANTSPKLSCTQPLTPLPTPPLEENNFNFEISNPELSQEYYFYGQLINTGSQNSSMNNELNYYNGTSTLTDSNNLFELSSDNSTLLQNSSEFYDSPSNIFENISTELAYPKYMQFPNNSSQLEEPYTLDFIHNNTDNVNPFEWNYEEFHHY